MKTGLRILMPSIYFPPRVGGIESHVYYLARELVSRGNAVHVVTTRTEKASPRHEVMDGVVVTRLPSFGKHPAGWTASSMYAIPTVVRLAAEHDIIHCHTFALALAGNIASKFRGRPLVVTLHESHFLRWVKKRLMRVGFRMLLRPASVLLSTSKEIDGVARDLLPAASTFPIVNGIDTETFKPAEPSLKRDAGEFLIVCPRRLVEKNGVEFLVRALPLLKGKLSLKVYVAGDGPLRNHLETVACELGVSDQIGFMGSVDNSLMPSLLSSADLVVIPSLIEATSIAALEAMSCQRVVAASRVGGLPEIIDDEVGILFEPGQPESIARAVIAAATQLDRTRMGKQARLRVEENWSIRRVAEFHERLYCDVLKESGHA